jgi:hypothetical protein
MPSTSTLPLEEDDDGDKYKFAVDLFWSIYGTTKADGMACVFSFRTRLGARLRHKESKTSRLLLLWCFTSVSKLTTNLGALISLHSLKRFRRLSLYCRLVVV